MPLARLERARLLTLDFESGVKHHNVLIIFNYVSQHCASVLINVLILVGNLTANSALRGPKKRFGGIGHASPTGSSHALYGATLSVMSKCKGWRSSPVRDAYCMMPSVETWRDHPRPGAYDRVGLNCTVNCGPQCHLLHIRRLRSSRPHECKPLADPARLQGRSRQRNPARRFCLARRRAFSGRPRPLPARQR